MSKTGYGAGKATAPATATATANATANANKEQTDNKFDAVLNQHGIICCDDDLRAALGGDKYTKFCRRLIMRTAQKVGPDKVAKVFKYEFNKQLKKRVIILPRGIVNEFVKETNCKLHVNIPAGRKVDVKLTGQLFDNQKIVIKNLLDGVYSKASADAGRGTCVMNLKAGQGKTFIAAGLIAEINCSTLYIVPRVELQKQAKRDFTVALKDAIVIEYNSKTTEEEMQKADVVIIVVNTAQKKPHDFFAKFGFIVYDEVHMYCSAERSKLFWLTGVRYVMGMSATTEDRTDGFDFVYHKQLGKVVHSDLLEGYDKTASEFEGEVMMINYHGKPEHTINKVLEATGAMFVPDMIQQFIKDPYRNEIIINEVVALYEDKEHQRNIFVFTEYRDHIDILQKLLGPRLKQSDDAFAPELATMKGGIKSNERERALKSRIILTTYGYSSTGLSIVKMNAIVFASPRKNGFKQICARILRTGSDVKIPRKFIDIVDAETGMRGQQYTRKKAYAFYGLSIATKKIDVRKEPIVKCENKQE